jgi:plasmid stabilization system protein ParE
VTRRFVFHAEAREDLREAARFYERDVAGLGAEFIAEVRTAVMRLRSHPESAPEFAGGTRRKLLARFPYGIIYLHENAALEIVAIVHNRRDPNSWIERLG